MYAVDIKVIAFSMKVLKIKDDVYVKEELI